MNTTLLGDLGPNSFVTMSLASLEVQAQSLTYSNAGHPSGYVMDCSGEIKSVMHSTRIPLGIMADWEGQPSRTIPLERGDILVFVTDGILESWGADGKTFGVESALKIIGEHRREPARQILDRLLDEVHRSLMGAIQEDDMTAVICKWVTPHDRYGWRTPRNLRHLGSTRRAVGLTGRGNYSRAV